MKRSFSRGAMSALLFTSALALGLGACTPTNPGETAAGDASESSSSSAESEPTRSPYELAAARVLEVLDYPVGVTTNRVVESLTRYCQGDKETRDEQPPHGGPTYGTLIKAAAEDLCPVEPSETGVVYEVEGGSVMATYRTATGTEQRTVAFGMWAEGKSFLDAGDVSHAYLSVQNQLSSGPVTCRILRDGEVIAENTSTGGGVIASCEG